VAKNHSFARDKHNSKKEFTQMNLFAVPPFITAFLILFLGVFVLTKNRKAHINRVFSIFSLILVIWLFGYGMMYLSVDKEQALFWGRTGFLGIIFIPILTYHFICTFLELKCNKSLIVIYLLAIPSLLLAYSKYIYSGINRYFWGFYPTAGRVYILFISMFVILFSKGLWLLVKHYRSATGLRKEQIKYLCLAFAAGTFGIIDYLIKYRPFYNIYPFGYICALAFYSIIAYAILRYRLLDINIVLTRAGIFVILYTAILGVPFWLGYVTKSWLISTGFAVCFASGGPLIYQYLRRRAEDMILKHQHRYQAALRELSKTMTRIRDLNKLMQAIVLSVVETVKVSYAAIYLREEEYKSYQLKHCFPKKEGVRFGEFIAFDSGLIKTLLEQKRPVLAEEIKAQEEKVRLDSGLVIPCFMEDELLGFMVLGAKPEHQAYTPDDLIVFETLSYSTSLAIENCRFWKDVDEHQRQARIAEMDLFSYSVAHEIDNPMAIIKGQVELIRKILHNLTLPEDKLKEIVGSLDFIVEAQDRTTTMVKALEDYGKPVPAELVPVKLEEVIHNYIKLYTPQFKHEGIYFEKEVPEQLPYLRGIRQELVQVLVNLSNNAIHATLGAPQGEGRRIHLKIEAANADIVRISLSDNGYGIVPDKLQSIFAPFTTTKASSEGRGMGLFTVKKIIEKHHGKIWAESEGKGKGATFIIELPIAKDIKPDDFEKGNKGRRMF
jgi:signal transduction histidine kinase